MVGRKTKNVQRSLPLHRSVRFTTSALTELSTEVAKSALKRTRWGVMFAQECWKSPRFGGAAHVWMIYCLCSQNKLIWPVVMSLIKELQMYRGSKVLCWINKQKWQQWVPHHSSNAARWRLVGNRRPSQLISAFLHLGLTWSHRTSVAQHGELIEICWWLLHVFCLLLSGCS